MGKIQLLSASILLGITAAAAEAGPPVRIGIGIGFGAPYYYRPYPYYYGYGYPYYPYAVAPPVVIQAPPVVVAPGTVVSSSPPTITNASPTFNAPEPTQLTAANPNAQASLDYHVSRLTNPDEAIRRESVMELGRSRSERAMDPLAATLAGDKSPSVREAAARALGIIASPRSMTVLIQAAQADNDRDVRHSTSSRLKSFARTCRKTNSLSLLSFRAHGISGLCNALGHKPLNALQVTSMRCKRPSPQPHDGTRVDLSALDLKFGTTR